MGNMDGRKPGAGAAAQACGLGRSCRRKQAAWISEEEVRVLEKWTLFLELM